MHYSLAESGGSVKLTVLKKEKFGNEESKFGIRTVEDKDKEGKDKQSKDRGTAVAGVNYTPMDKEYKFLRGETEQVVEVAILEDKEWTPDLDFFVELYDPDTEKKERFAGADTRAKVTILDDNAPGSLSFQSTNLTVAKGASKVDIVIWRTEGSDGKVSCRLRTAPMEHDDKKGKDGENDEGEQDGK